MLTYVFACEEKLTQATRLFEEGCEHDKNNLKERAFICWKESAELEHSNAQHNVGFCFLAGIGVEKNFDEAFIWLEKAADQFLTESQVTLAKMYSSDKYGREDISKSCVFLRMAISKGCQEALCMLIHLAEHDDIVEAQMHLSDVFQSGAGVLKNDNLANKFLLIAAKKGHIKAQMNLGLKYLNGDGVPKDIKEACNWFFKAAKQDDKGYKELNTLAEQNCAEAQFYLGVYYRELKNLEKACQYLGLAAAQGHQEAQVHLIRINYPSKKDEKLGLKALENLIDKGNQVAVKFLKDLTDSEHTEAQLSLVRLLINGCHIEKDEKLLVETLKKLMNKGNKEAVEIFEDLVNQGSPEAMSYRGEVLMNKAVDSLNPDFIKEAHELFYRASMRGHKTASHYLQQFFPEGIDLSMGPGLLLLNVIEKRAEQSELFFDDLKMLHKVGTIYLEGIGVPKDEESAFAIMKEAAEGGFYGAMIDLIFMYNEGIGVPQNKEEADKWKAITANQGSQNTSR